MAEQAEATDDRENLLLPGEPRWEGGDGEPIIELVDVYKSFGDDHVLKGLSLKVMPGKITIIIGASGSGKSVLIKHMNGLLRPDKGTVRLFGQDVSKLGDQALDRLRKRVGTMFQNYALFDSLTVRENVAFALVEHGAMARAQAEELAETIIEDLDLGHALDQYPATLSGGMKKRVSLARAIVSNPEVVLFDEPTTGLDPVMMEFVDKLIEEITRKYALTSVLISHDLATIFRIADQVAVLAEGKIICVGRPEEIRESEDPRVQELIGGKAKSQIEVHASDGAEKAEMIVRMKGVHKGWGSNQVLRGVDFEVPRGTLTTLIGGSGSGKSVMMKHLLGLLKADRGRVEVFGQDLSKLSEGDLRELRTKVGMLFQHAALFDSMSVRENVAFPLVERRVCSRKEAHERTDRLLEQLKLMEIADQVPVQISSGQQKRVSLARALVTEPELLIYDEPTTGQDPIMSLYVEEMIMEVQESFDVTSIVISHDMASAFRTADVIAMLHKGEIIACGPPQVIAAAEDERVRNFVYAADVAAQEREAAARRGGGG
ncbi:ABC transporter ATP-binding protein [Bradymonadaceae bacterium TMQ3]|nr:ABC transporter ATP-binding protein [Bradymonadaceae bacterium TMQ3]TXC77938.1 ABC transporter ATP-binding protein [Bradymonadales bacterium TMQ1]